MNSFTTYNKSIIASLPNVARLLSLFTLLFLSISVSAQEKTKKEIQIEEADLLLFNETVIKNAQRLIGNVRLWHETMIMICDSAWAYSGTNVVDAYGNVHIISNDTVNMWAEYIKYDGNTELAKARINVILKDPSLTLYTDSLDFEMATEIGYYKNGGKIVDSTNVLKSRIGEYFTKRNQVYFIDSVSLENEDYTLLTDTMIYNTETEVVHFSGSTYIKGDSINMYSTSGWFNTKTNETEMGKKSSLKQIDSELAADYIHYNDNTGKGTASGNVEINDYANNMIILGGNAEYNDFNEYAMVTDSAMWIQHFEGDSLFLHADTLFTMPDTSATDQKLLIGYGSVRFYRTDMQGSCDSLVYFTRDSTIQLYKNPIVWSGVNQLSADFVEFKNNSTPPNKVYLNKNSFIVQQNDSTKFNQIKGKNMVGFIEGQSLYKIDVNGNGQSVYYPADDRNYIGINKAESSKIILYLKDNMVSRITFAGAPDGSMNPLPENITPEMRLDGFKWREDERPKNKFDIFPKNINEHMEQKTESSTEKADEVPSKTNGNNQLLNLPDKPSKNMPHKN